MCTCVGMKPICTQPIITFLGEHGYYLLMHQISRLVYMTNCISEANKSEKHTQIWKSIRFSCATHYIPLNLKVYMYN